MHCLIPFQASSTKTICMRKIASFLFFALFLCQTVWSQTCQRIVLDDFDSERNVSSYTLVETDKARLEIRSHTSTSSIPKGNCLVLVPKEFGANYTVSLILKLDKIKNANLLRNGIIRLKMDMEGDTTVVAILRRKGASNSSTVIGKHTRLESFFSPYFYTWHSLSFFPSNVLLDNTVYADSISEIELQVTFRNGGPFYMDNLCLESIYYSIDNFDSERNLAPLSAQGTLDTAVVNDPTDRANSSSKCATFKKTSGTSSICYPVTPHINVNRLKRGVDLLGLQVFSPSSPLLVRASLIDTNTSPHAVHSVYEGKGSYGGNWNFTSLRLSSQPNPAMPDSNVDIISFEIDPNGSDLSPIKLDDFTVYTFVPPTPSTIIGQALPCKGTETYDYSVPAVENASCEWLISGSKTAIPTASPFSIKALFNVTPWAIECRYVMAEGCYSDWYYKPFNTLDQKATVTLNSGSPFGCEGRPLSLYGAYTGGNTAEWKSSGTGTFGPNNYTPSSADADAGSVDITYTTLGGNCGTASRTIKVLAMHQPSFENTFPADTQLCSTASSITLRASGNVGSNVYWYGPKASGFSIPNPVENGTPITYTFDPTDKAGGKPLQLKVSSDYAYPCGMADRLIGITFVSTGPACLATSSSKAALPNAQVHLFPNPSTDGHLLIQSNEEVKEVQVTNVLGQSEVFLSNEIHTSLKGILSVSIRTATQKTLKKVVVE